MRIVPHTPRTRPAPRDMAVSFALVLTCLLLLGSTTAKTSWAAAPQHSCSTDALAFCEALEPVIEAVTDGRPNRVQPAALRAQAWWTAHRAGFANAAAIDSTMRDLTALASAHRAPLAARAAVVAATAALDACHEPATDAGRVMRIDLAGMAGWLRAHGVNTPFPGGVAPAAQSISDRLRANGHEALAAQLSKDLAATLAIPARVEGNVHAADSLLQRVDEVEQALR